MIRLSALSVLQAGWKQIIMSTYTWLAAKKSLKEHDSKLIIV